MNRAVGQRRCQKPVHIISVASLQVTATESAKRFGTSQRPSTPARHAAQLPHRIAILATLARERPRPREDRRGTLIATDHPTAVRILLGVLPLDPAGEKQHQRRARQTQRPLRTKGLILGRVRITGDSESLTLPRPAHATSTPAAGDRTTASSRHIDAALSRQPGTNDGPPLPALAEPKQPTRPSRWPRIG